MYIPTKQTINKKIDNKGTVRIISNFRHNDEGEMTHMIRVLGHKQLLVENLRSFPTEWICMKELPNSSHHQRSFYLEGQLNV